MALISRCLCLSLLIILIMVPNSTSVYLCNFCSNTTMFESNSVYQTHVNTILHSLSSNAANSTGFFTTFLGSATTETVYGLFMCRGDQDTKACHECVTMATSELPQKFCPNRKVAIIWYDECMVSYSNESLVGKMDLQPTFFLLNSQVITGNVTQFTDVLGQMMNTVSNEAANGGSLKKFATDIKSLNSRQNLYVLGQCTPDLSASDCNQCLRVAIEQLPIRRGARVLQPSCSVRYEMYPFFNGATNLSSPPPPSPQTNSTKTPVIRTPIGYQKSKVSVKVIIAIVFPLVAISLVVLTVSVWIIRKNAKNHDTIVVATGDDDFSTVESLQYDFDTLQSATSNFSDENKLGEGGFGGVYKGILPNGQEIAVKRLSKQSGQGIQAFKNEVLLISKLQHRNLVKVLGFCFNQEEKLLVYEYVANKSLDHFIFDPEKQVHLDWGMRGKIIKGIARGILYLHEDSQVKIVHRDLKASNVLLDMDMNPKISDFGMARIFSVEQSQEATSRVVGTYGYMAPEYAMHGQFSSKSDVYSFGVLVLEIISGKRNSSFYQTGHAEDLLSVAWMKWRDGNPLEFMDPVIRQSCSIFEVMRCIQLALLCVQESAYKRPTMATILLTLESHSITLSAPEKPVLFDKSREDSSIAKHAISDQSSYKSAPLGPQMRSQSLQTFGGLANHSFGGSLC